MMIQVTKTARESYSKIMNEIRRMNKTNKKTKISCYCRNYLKKNILKYQNIQMEMIKLSLFDRSQSGFHDVTTVKIL